MAKELEVYCDFCGKMAKYVDKLIGAKQGKIHICNECISLCVEFLLKEGLELKILDLKKNTEDNKDEGERDVSNEKRGYVVENP